MLKKFESIFLPLAVKIGKNKYLVSIRDGFLVSTPLLIVGSIFLVLGNLPVPNYKPFLSGIFGENIFGYFDKVVDGTFTLMALLAVIGIAYAFSKEMKIDRIFGTAISVIAWFILMPYKVATKITIPVEDISPTSSVVAGLTSENGVYTITKEVFALNTKWLSSGGIFVGIIVCFLAIHIYSFAVKKGWKITMPEGVPDTVVDSFSALIPSGLVITVFFFINIIFTMTPYGNAFEFVYTILQTPLTNLGDSLGAMLIAYLFLHIFWFFGVNGGSVVGAVYNPVLRVLSLENFDAFQKGEPLPHIITGQFQDMFATFGGCGSTLSLVIVMLLICKSKRTKELSKLSVVPAIFGINEPIVFGFPIVLNPLIIIPFILAPLVNIVITYFAMDMGIVPCTNGVMMPWTTPPIISGFLTTGIRGSILQVVLIVIDCFIYYPFAKIIDKSYVKEEENATKKDEDDLDFSLADFSFDD